MAGMKKLMLPALLASIAGIALAPVAVADDQGYLDEVSALGLPVGDDNRDVLLQLGQQACLTAHEDPSMQPEDLAMQIVEARASYNVEMARIVVTAALHNYCPEAPAVAPS